MLPGMHHPDLMADYGGFSDAGVFRLRGDLALVQTVDFFPPIVDGPRDFGRIAAANALSDCYAMGGSPLTALNIAAFPSKKLPVEVLGEILAGGAEKVLEAGAVVVGGHTIDDAEVKYGLCVTGTAHPDRIVSNGGARPGQALVLTKPLGMGTVSTAIKKERMDEAAAREAIEIMATLNRDASEAMLELRATGATDVTGFGLLGHAFELAEASGVTVRIAASHVPILPGVHDLAAEGFLSGGVRKNRDYVEVRVRFLGAVDEVLVSLLFDSETSGGLLIALDPDAAGTLIAILRSKGHDHAAVVGEVVTRREQPVEVAP
jgi:selenide,water dikinase